MLVTSGTSWLPVRCQQLDQLKELPAWVRALDSYHSSLCYNDTGDVDLPTSWPHVGCQQLGQQQGALVIHSPGQLPVLLAPGAQADSRIVDQCDHLAINERSAEASCRTPSMPML